MNIEALFEREDLINDKISNMSERERRISQIAFAIKKKKISPTNESIYSELVEELELLQNMTDENYLRRNI